MTSIAPEAARLRPRRLLVAGVFVALAVALLPFADLSLAGHDPAAVLLRMGQGLLSPDLSGLASLANAALLTVAFAICGVFAGASAGFLLAPFYDLRSVRLVCITVRSVHELFWALLLLQVTGLSATTGVLAIAIPYAGIFAKVFAEYLDEADRRPAAAMPPGADRLSVHVFARLPLVRREFLAYLLYRVECGLRSSAVLGFVGLPTLGFELDTFFRQGLYGQVASVLLLYYAVIATIRLWMRWPLAPLYLLASIAVLAALHTPPMAPGALLRFLTSDIVPAPLRNGALADTQTWLAFGDWLRMLFVDQALPGLTATMIVAQLALVMAGLVAILAVPLAVRAVSGRFGAGLGHVGLVIGRSTPEYMLAYIALQVFGPSMLPAVIALGLHNGAIIAHLLSRQSTNLHATLRADAPRGLDLYAFELLPRIYGSFLALCLYRWEIIVRESAIVGLLGIATLGFYVDRAVQEVRVDRAIVLLLVTVGATILIDIVSRRLRRSIGAPKVSTGAAAPGSLSPPLATGPTQV